MDNISIGAKLFYDEWGDGEEQMYTRSTYNGESLPYISKYESVLRRRFSYNSLRLLSSKSDRRIIKNISRSKADIKRKSRTPNVYRILGSETVTLKEINNIMSEGIF